MKILGISCFYHDAAAALLCDGELVAAAHEERFTRKRHDPDVPVEAAKYCLQEAGLSIDDIDYVAFYDKPCVKFERILMTYLATFPRSLPSFSKSIPIWLKEKLWVPRVIHDKIGFEGEVLFAGRAGVEVVDPESQSVERLSLPSSSMNYNWVSSHH